MNTPQDISIPFWDRPESRQLEFKERFPTGDNVAKTTVAFANGPGGRIVFGVRNQPRQIIGVPDDDLFILEERVLNHIFSLCTPAIIPEIYIQAVEGKNILVVEIFPGSHKPYYIKSKGKHKGTYIRIGSTNKPASPETLEELERQRRNIPFDSSPVYDITWKDLDLTQFMSDYARATGRKLEENQLKNLGLLVKERGQLYPTNAAVLLANPSSFTKGLFPFAKIECARFKGNIPNIFLDQTCIDPPLHLAPEMSIAFIKKNIALRSTIGEVYREDRWEYPLDAIREAVTNAIVHRDYSLMGSDIKVAIFDDMLEITSPGPLPDTMSLEDLGTGRSEIRNHMLAPIFKDLGLIEAWGTGMRKIKEAVSKYSEIEVIFQEAGYSFQVQFRKRSIVGEVAEQQSDKYRTTTGQVPDKLKLLDFCREERSVKEMMAFLNLKHRENFSVHYLQPLIEESLLSMTIPEKPNSPRQKYRITAKGMKDLEQFSTNYLDLHRA